MGFFYRQYFFKMKYTRLSKEQLEALHEEFATFLATQQITADEWAKLKTEKPNVAEDELDVFSDLVWEKVLSNALYLDKIEDHALYCFKIDTDAMQLILVKTNAANLTTVAGLEWLQNNLQNTAVELFTASKKYTTDKNSEVFQLIKQGAVLSKGDWYLQLEKAI